MATLRQCCLLIVPTIFFTTFFVRTKTSLSCEPGWTKTPSGETCVKAFVETRRPWNDARLVCQSAGGDLVTIRDDTKSNFIKDLEIPRNFWIGLHYTPAEDKWH
ncbi:secretory phospholipase a2 receptor [Plakobranchus ocellatus]|uniref:Secretory phospholipase a2 receptor n=1 Tax=Plakobranchus ocellatus TaxID=259542 RepID=A0AAV4AJW5_9GAST|nr:secretory phospholipase a2 receptor [Plakobranchus ocellatus]